jgi:transposase
MAIKRHKRGERVYRAEYKTVRVDGKVKCIYVRYVGVEGPPKITRKPRANKEHKLEFSRTTQTGDVTVLWHLAEELGIHDIIDQVCLGFDHSLTITPGKILSIWAINRVIDPESATQLPEWVRATDLPLLAGISPKSFSKDVFLEALDFICSKDSDAGRIFDLSPPIEDRLCQRWRQVYPLPPGESEVVAYDMTAILFFGNTCPIACLGHNAEHIARKQVNLAILVSKFDRYPIFHFTYPGDRNSVTTIQNLFCKLSDLAIKPGTVIWDRGNVSEKSIKCIEDLHWDIICGLPKTTTVVQTILHDTEIPKTPQYQVKKTACGGVYARKVQSEVFGKMRSITIYANPHAAIEESEDRNARLSTLSQKISPILRNSENLKEEKVIAALKSVLKSKIRFFTFAFKEINDRVTGTWEFNEEAIKDAQQSDGKWAILSTKDNLSAKEVIDEYFGKDFVEKKFQDVKSGREIMPVRHRLENRVKSYIFLNVLSLRIHTALVNLFRSAFPEDAAECASDFLKKMARVERTQVTIDHKQETVFLNLTPDLQKTLKIIGLNNLFPCTDSM